MKLSALKRHLENNREIIFIKPDGESIPKHFHITEAGLVSRHFIDCGGSIHKETSLCFQIWVAGDHEHRLDPTTFKKIISKSETLLEDDDPEIEIEYQTDTIGKYGLDSDGQHLVLTTTYTACPADSQCGKHESQLADHHTGPTSNAPCCTPESVCC